VIIIKIACNAKGAALTQGNKPTVGDYLNGFRNFAIRSALAGGYKRADGIRAVSLHRSSTTAGTSRARTTIIMRQNCNENHSLELQYGFSQEIRAPVSAQARYCCDTRV
jgi:hypothetical protein